MVSEETTTSSEAVQESQEETPITDETRMANALNYLGQGELDKANEEQTVPEEQAAQQQEQEQPATDDRSDYYAKLVEKDKEIRHLKSQLKTGGPDYKELAKEDPAKVLEELGIGVDQVLDSWVNKEAEQAVDSPEQPEQKPNEEVVKLKQELEQFKQERQQAMMQQAYNNEMGKIYQKVNAEGEDRWELVKTTNNYELVLDTAAEMYKANPDDPPEYEDVLTAVENYLEEHYGKMYEQLSKVSKLHNKFAVKTEEPKAPEKIQQEMNKPPIPSPTLSTAHSSDTPTPRGFTEAERFERALSVLENSGD